MHPPTPAPKSSPQVRNSTPQASSYAFRKIEVGSDCATAALGRAGRYALEFHVAEAPFVPVLSISIVVRPGAPAGFVLEGSFGSAAATAAAADAARAGGDSSSQEARRGPVATKEDVQSMVTTAAATAPAGRLGSFLCDLNLRFFDAQGNLIQKLARPRPVVHLYVKPVSSACDIEAKAKGSARGTGGMSLHGFKVEGALGEEQEQAEGEPEPLKAPLGLFSPPPTVRGCADERLWPPSRAQATLHEFSPSHSAQLMPTVSPFIPLGARPPPRASPPRKSS